MTYSSEDTRLSEEVRQLLEAKGWKTAGKELGKGWQVTADDGKIVLLVHASTLPGAWIGLLAEVTEELSRRQQES